jgi:allantoin racemase
MKTVSKNIRLGKSQSWRLFMQIRVLLPVLPSPALIEKAIAEYRTVAGRSADISVACLGNGTSTIESDLDIALAQPETIRLARDAEADGIDACIVACFSDPGLDGAREVVSIPVIGEGQAGLHLASLVAGRFSVITTWDQCIPRVRRLVHRAGFGNKLASVRATGVGVMALSNDCVGRMAEQSIKAVKDEGAEAIVLGCTGTGENLPAAISAAVRANVGVPVPIIDPVPAAFAFASACVRIGLRHSKMAYPQIANVRPEFRFAPTVHACTPGELSCPVAP